jgi:hypothetical protein
MKLKQQVLDFKLSIWNNGTKEELIEVLNYVFGGYNKTAAMFNYYFRSRIYNDSFGCNDVNQLPHRPVKDFIKEMNKVNSNYQQTKKLLKNISDDVKLNHPTDKPLIRQTINDSAYSLSKYFNLSKRERDLLNNYACKLHPKDK